MSRDHVSFVKAYASPEVEVYRVCELETVATSGEVTLAIAVFDRRKLDASIVPCGPWSGEKAIASVVDLFNESKVEAGRMPPPPYGGRRMLYLLAEAKAALRNGAHLAGMP